MKLRSLIGSTVLLGSVVAIVGGLAAWKRSSLAQEQAASANQPAPVEAVVSAVVDSREHLRTTTSIGTVVALRSVVLRNELPGTVREVYLTPGEIVDEGTVLVALDVSVEEAELRAQEAQASLAETLLGRMQRASENNGASAADVDRARAERDVELANVERIRAIIERKTIRAPFRARVGIADVHPGQYLDGGTPLTTLQGVDAAAHVDFYVAQDVAAGLEEGETVVVVGAPGSAPIDAHVVAVDARVDPATRNALVRARIDAADHEGDGAPAPGSSVRVRVPRGQTRSVQVVPVSALRKGPAGDHVFVLERAEDGSVHARQRMVVSGPVLGDVVVIEEGLALGEEVAATGSFKLYEGALVAIVGSGS